MGPVSRTAQLLSQTYPYFHMKKKAEKQRRWPETDIHAHRRPTEHQKSLKPTIKVVRGQKDSVQPEHSDVVLKVASSSFIKCGDDGENLKNVVLMRLG